LVFVFFFIVGFFILLRYYSNYCLGFYWLLCSFYCFGHFPLFAAADEPQNYDDEEDPDEADDEN
jgi:hypothetical protein